MKILVTESQIKKIITEIQHLEWYDDNSNEAFENVTDEKIIDAFEKYGLTADPSNCNGCKIDYHPKGEIEVFYDTYALDGEFDDNIHKILKKISDELGAEKMYILEPGSVKFLFYN